MITYTPFNAAKCWGLTAKSVALAERAGGMARQCTNTPATADAVALPGISLCYAHYLAYQSRTLAFHPDSPAAAPAAPAPPVCDCPVGKCPVTAGGDVPAGRACARYDGVYAA